MRLRGFTLIELMIVITLIAIITSIAIPNLIESKRTANETAVISTLRTISANQEIYCSRFGTYGTLGNMSAEGFIDELLGVGSKHGYNFNVPTADSIQWICTAVPAVVGESGYRGFRVDNSGVLRFTSDGTPPISTSPPLNE